MSKQQQELIQENAAVKFETTFIDDIENEQDFYYKNHRYKNSVNNIELTVSQKKRKQTQSLKEITILHIVDADNFLRDLKYNFSVEINSEKNLTISVYKDKDLPEHWTYAIQARQITFKDTKITFIKPYQNIKNNKVCVNLETNYFDRYHTDFNKLVNDKIRNNLVLQTENLASFEKFYQTPNLTSEDLTHFSILNFDSKIVLNKEFLKTKLTKQNQYLNALPVPKIVIEYQPIYEIKQMFQTTQFEINQSLSSITSKDIIGLINDYNFMFFKYLNLSKITNEKWKIEAVEKYQKIIRCYQEISIKYVKKEEPKEKDKTIDNDKEVNNLIDNKNPNENIEKN